MKTNMFSVHLQKFFCISELNPQQSVMTAIVKRRPPSLGMIKPFIAAILSDSTPTNDLSSMVQSQ
ncbi:hypothetical protein [Aeribacillus alveayuensis]|uniref:Uncharacterized protein n=1 Tax=Aeribacillus alveayuensis TaxID=279215 RepID=A0ABT9VRY6_9BACI|nr:hypothetical protein [Bacillus alveayuensis]